MANVPHDTNTSFEAILLDKASEIVWREIHCKFGSRNISETGGLLSAVHDGGLCRSLPYVESRDRMFPCHSQMMFQRCVLEDEAQIPPEVEAAIVELGG